MLLKKLLNKIYYLILGHFTVFKHSFKRAVTVEYPEKKVKLPERFRGKHVWNSNECVGCKICEKVCPVNAIHINKVEDNFEMQIELSKCIFCGNCQYSCLKHAIKMSNDFELAVLNKNDLNLNITSNEKKIEAKND